jgi:hypothetical protein
MSVGRLIKRAFISKRLLMESVCVTPNELTTLEALGLVVTSEMNCCGAYLQLAFGVPQHTSPGKNHLDSLRKNCVLQSFAFKAMF